MQPGPPSKTPTTALMLLWTAFWLHLLGLALQRLCQVAVARRLRLAALPVAGLIFYPTFYGVFLQQLTVVGAISHHFLCAAAAFARFPWPSWLQHTRMAPKSFSPPTWL